MSIERDIPGHEHVHPAITAVVERSEHTFKVCITSRPVRFYEGCDLFRMPSERNVRAAMENRAQGVAHTYGATYVTAVA